MKKTTYIFTSIILIVSILTSCRKVEDPDDLALIEHIETVEQNEYTTTTYTQIEVGNYWIYQGYYVDTDNNTESIVEYLVDSLYIEKDTVINNETYYIQKGELFGAGEFKRIMRVDNNKLVSPEGEVFFKLIEGIQVKDTLEINTNVSGNQIDSIYNVMENNENLVLTPSSIYTVFYHRHKLFHLNNGYKPLRYKSDYYVGNIGVVQYTSYIENGPIDIHMRLLRYHVN